ncbi:hypothetical protein [Ruminococcus albus]|uniref:hypothetical protein n=1 Tax=Ruminococcus albus TaxID=1264 RepID=UPI001FA6DF12|nr:hypothetical protein [Ruminococcus albus]
MSKNKNSTTAFRVALGGICAAVCLLLMFSSSFLPGLSYAIPVFAGVLMVVMIVETDSKWAIADYCAVSLLCIFITPNFEASLLFILFMGYYPILQFRLSKEKKQTFSLDRQTCSFQYSDSYILQSLQIHIHIGGYARRHRVSWKICNTPAVG